MQARLMPLGPRSFETPREERGSSGWGERVCSRSFRKIWSLVIPGRAASARTRNPFLNSKIRI